MLSMTATARELAPQAVSDVRYIRAANNLRVIAATLHQVSDDVLLKLANVNRTGCADCDAPMIFSTFSLSTGDTVKP